MITLYNNKKRYYIYNAITAMIENNIQLSKLLNNNDLFKQATGTRRTIKELLQHTLTIPMEEILLLKGFSKQEIYKKTTVNVSCLEDFQRKSISQLKQIEKELEKIKLFKKYTNIQGTSMTGIEWCFEILSHYSHHRSQIYISIINIGYKVPQQIAQQFFPGHLK